MHIRVVLSRFYQLILLWAHFTLSKYKCSVSVKVIGLVSKPDFTSGSSNTNTSQYHIAGTLGLDSKDMLYSRTDLRPGSIPLLFPFGEFPVTRPLALNMFTVSFLVQLFQLLLRTVRRISPYSTTGIVFVQQLIKHLAVMNLRTGHTNTADQFVLHIQGYMVLVTVIAFAVFLCPPGISILLAFLVLIPAFRLFALFDLLVLFTAVSLNRNSKAGFTRNPMKRMI